MIIAATANRSHHGMAGGAGAADHAAADGASTTTDELTVGSTAGWAHAGAHQTADAPNARSDRSASDRDIGAIVAQVSAPS